MFGAANAPSGFRIPVDLSSQSPTVTDVLPPPLLAILLCLAVAGLVLVLLDGVRDEARNLVDELGERHVLGSRDVAEEPALGEFYLSLDVAGLACCLFKPLLKLGIETSDEDFDLVLTFPDETDFDAVNGALLY